MSKSQALFVALLSSALALPQMAVGEDISGSSRITLPITFTGNVSADRARAGDVVRAKTTQVVKLASGEVIPSGTEVLGHVAVATPFRYDKTPYAAQKEGVLEITFDSVRVAGHDVPLKVEVRAMADPLATLGASEAKSTDLDSLGTLTLIGGDQLVPSQSEVVNRNGDVVAYNKRNGVYAHLIAHAGCDGGNVEVSVGIFSPTACGLYGFADVTARETGSTAAPSRLSLVSTHMSPKIWSHSTALLETLPEDGAGR